MTRTPDEIKRELDNPIRVHFHISDIEPRLTPLALHDLEFLHADALAYIQQLQADNAQLNRCIENMTDKLNAMNDEVAKLQAERDALIKYITDSSWAACDICKHGIDGASAMDCKHIREVGVPCFEWRGVQKEAPSC